MEDIRTQATANAVASQLEEKNTLLTQKEYDTQAHGSRDKTASLVKGNTADNPMSNMEPQQRKLTDLIPRSRKLTEKGLQEKIARLKRQQTSALSAVSRKRTELSNLMLDVNNSHLLKEEISNVNCLFEQLKKAFKLHFDELTSENEREKEYKYHKIKENDILEYLRHTRQWIKQTEAWLSDQIDSGSISQSSGSRSSKASSVNSARAKEKAKLAELMAEKSKIKQRQALQAATEDLNLEIEIAKTEAREKAFAEIEEEEMHSQSRENICDPERGLVDHHTDPKPTATLSTSYIPATPLVPFILQPTPVLTKQVRRKAPFSLPRFPVNTIETSAPVAPVFTSTTFSLPQFTKEPSPLCTSAKEFLPQVKFANTRKNANPLTRANNVTEDRNQSISIPVNPESPRILQSTFEDMIALQQKQNKQFIASHQQLAAAIALPQPSVPKFKGDPADYRAFVMAFDSRIKSKTSSSADLLYYLNQHVEDEPKDIIERCLHMEFEDGYEEARRLLEKEYGHPYKISMTYINKLLDWSPIKFDDSGALKSFSIFLTKCNNAMKNIQHMEVLDHAPNMQAVVGKLPTYLQSRWRDQVH